MALLLLVVLLAVLGPVLLPDPQFIDTSIRNTQPFSNWAHPLGADLLGRDTLARLSQALQIAFTTGVISLLVALILGALPGLMILARQPQIAPIIVKTISQFMVLFWVISVSALSYLVIFEAGDNFANILRLILIVALFCAVTVLLVLRKKSALLPEVIERTRWTGLGWRIVRLLLSIPMAASYMVIVVESLDSTLKLLPPTLHTGITIGLTIAPFTLRTTLAAGQPNRAIKALSLGLFSALAWAMLAAACLDVFGLEYRQEIADFGRLIVDNLPYLNVSLSVLVTLTITIIGLVLTGDGIRLAYLKRPRNL